MDDHALSTLAEWGERETSGAASGRADEAFLKRVREERSRRRRPVIAVFGAATAIAACALLAFVLFPQSPAPTQPSAPILANATPPRPAPTSIEPASATLATLMRLNAGRDDLDLDSLVLSRADCVAWTRTISPLGP